MNDYGYHYSEMNPLGAEDAVLLFNKGETVYALYPDDTGRKRMG